MDIAKDYDGDIKSIVTVDGEVYFSADDLVDFFESATREAEMLSHTMANETDRLTSHRYKRTFAHYAKTFRDLKAERVKGDWSYFDLKEVDQDNSADDETE